MSALATAPPRTRTCTPAADAMVACRALAPQYEAIDALPEAELRRVLKLIGGTDPAAVPLQNPSHSV